jgi:hypothetical protein
MKETKLRPFESISMPGTAMERVVSTCSVVDRLEMLGNMTLLELRQVVADKDVQLTVRKAAELMIRRIQRVLSSPPSE